MKNQFENNKSKTFNWKYLLSWSLLTVISWGVIIGTTYAVTKKDLGSIFLIAGVLVFAGWLLAGCVIYYASTSIKSSSKNNSSDVSEKNVSKLRFWNRNKTSTNIYIINIVIGLIIFIISLIVYITI